MQVHSQLGQPLRASIAYALAPNEALYDSCISLSQARSANGMPSLRQASIDVSNGVISLTGQRAVKEPLVSARVIVDCPYTPHISREYTLFIDPPGVVAEAAAPASVAAPVQAARPEPAPAVRPRAAARAEPLPIENTTSYRVQPGDTLSGIAQRIENRPLGLWPTVNMIFAANPDAFIDGDMNKLKAGSVLELPDFGATQPATRAMSLGIQEPAAIAEQPAEAYEPSMAIERAPAEPATVVEDTAVEAPAAATPTETLVIPDTAVEAPAIAADSPNVPTASISRPAPVVEDSGRSWTWLLWLGGAGIALIAGLLLFGRRSRDLTEPSPLDAAPAHPMRRRSDLDPTDTEEMPVIAEEEYDIDDDEPTAENLALDADLVLGSGLDKGVDIDVAEDFAFASTASLDFELPEEMSSTTGTHRTDVIPPVNIEDSSILVSEILPQDSEEDDYDMSVIVDATKVPHPEDTTERDLKAVVVDNSDESLISDSYTLSQEVDFKILEQDYEDEMTATQKLNAEIAKAAAELTESMERMEHETDLSQTLATVTELDVTAQLPARNDDSVEDPDDTAEVTVNLEADDETVEMEAEGGKVDTKAV